MKGKPDLVKASQIAAAAKKVGGVYVVATRNQQLPQEENASAQIAEYPLAEYSCKECATVFTANAKMAPYCLTCGSDHTEVCSPKKGETAGKTSQTKVHADADLAHYACAGCGTLNVLHNEIVAACGDGAHCVSCGHKNVFATAADIDAPAGGDAGAGDLDDLDLVDTSDETLEAEAEGDEGSEDMDLDDLSGGDDDADEADEAADADEMPMNDPTAVDPAATPAPAVDAPAVDTNPVVDVAPGTALNVEYSEGDDMEVDLLDLNEDTPTEELSLVWLRDAMAIATAKNQLVATLVAADAGDNADIMETREFATAISHAISKEGLKAAAKRFGFKSVKASVPIAKVVKAQVEKALVEKAAELDSKLEKVHADFAQSTEIATAGVAKNFWRNVDDPLKKALISELSAVGVRNPQKMVDRVWAIHAPTTLAAILDKARELSKTSVEARNELAAALDMTNYIPTKKVVAEAEEDPEEDDDEPDEDEDDTVEARLSKGATAVARDREVVHSSAQPGKPGSGKQLIAAILNGQSGHFNH